MRKSGSSKETIVQSVCLSFPQILGNLIFLSTMIMEATKMKVRRRGSATRHCAGRDSPRVPPTSAAN